MFVGHLAVALAAKRARPEVPLSGLVAASFGIDLLWPVLLLAGIEIVRVAPGDTAFTALAFEHYPWSHSLLLVLLWSALAAWIAHRALGAAASALVVGAVVASHWLLDFVTHRPDLPLWPGGPRVGLGLWNTIPGTLILEGAMLAIAAILFARAFRARDRTGSLAFWTVVALLTLIWVSQPWSPPPPGPMAVAVVALTLWLLPLWAGWIERHRIAARG